MWGGGKTVLCVRKSIGIVHKLPEKGHIEGILFYLMEFRFVNLRRVNFISFFRIWFALVLMGNDFLEVLVVCTVVFGLIKEGIVTGKLLNFLRFIGNWVFYAGEEDLNVLLDCNWLHVLQMSAFRTSTLYFIRQ